MNNIFTYEKDNEIYEQEKRLKKKQHEQESKRLVDNDLSSLDYRVLKYLKEYALGKENAVSGETIKEYFGLGSTAEVRKIIKNIRISNVVNTIIGSNNNGYFIPYKYEYVKAVSLMLNRAISSVETIIYMMPSSAEILHKFIGDLYKRVEKSVEGQTQMRFNDWEQEVLRKFAEKYEEIGDELDE